MDIITGYVGSPHVTAEQDRDINIGIFGAESYVLRTGSQLKAEVSSNNEIKIRDGVIMHQGCAASIKKNTYDSLTIVNGSQGMKRIDLVVARYSRNQSTKVESLTLKVIQGTPVTGTPSAPGYTTGDIQAGDLVADMPLYQVVINGLNITAVKQVFNTVDTVAELNGKSIIDISKNHCKFANGLIVQWGTGSFPSSSSGGQGYATITFPIPFSDKSYTAIACAKYPGNAIPAFMVSTDIVSTSKMCIYGRTGNLTAITGAECRWIAIGY